MNHIKNIVNNRLFVIMLSLFSFFLIYKGIFILYTPRGMAVTLVNSIDNSIAPEKIPFYILLPQPAELKFTAKIRYQPEDFLVLPRISGNRIRVSLEGHEINQIGGETANIWPNFHWIHLPNEYSRKEVTLTLDLYGVYDLGVREIPYIVSGNSSSWFRHITAFVFNDLYWIIIGQLILFSTIQFYFSIIDKRLRVSYLLNIPGVVLGGFYLLEFVYRDSSGSIENYLWLRKFLLFAGFSAPWFMLASMEKYLLNRLTLTKIMGISILLSAFFLFHPSTLSELKKYTIYASIAGYLNWSLLFIIGFIHRKNILIYSLALFQASLTATLFSLLFPKSHILMIQIAYIFAAVSVAYSLIQDFGRLHNDFRQAYSKSILDPLTGAFNRYFLDEFKSIVGDIVILVDMNKFKIINDTHGHETGDRVLVEWVKSVKEHIRETDFVIRLGGDEFAIILRDTNESIIQNISENFSNRFTEFPVSFSYGVATVETTIEKAMIKADSTMYKHKKNSYNKSWLPDLFKK